MLVLAMAGALVLLGRLLRLPWGGIWAMLGVLWGAVMLAHLVLPAGHPLPRATGGDWRVWAVVGGLAALALAYRAALVA
ncbi:molybdopterin biosynthesis protein, partial [Candidatus Falkowbacteria bacterium]|nr:molybdopterin biosynthesis protein [Candidatus Falkowbacteria bacterium]